MIGWIFIALLAAAAGVAAWANLAPKPYRRGDDLHGFPLRAVKQIELRDALADDIDNDRTDPQ